MNASTDTSQLAVRLGFAAEHGRGDAYYRLSRIVARVLVSRRLKQRSKWLSLAKQLSQNQASSSGSSIKPSAGSTTPPPHAHELDPATSALGHARRPRAGHFFAAVHAHLPEYDQPLTIFGSAPIQLCMDESFASADVDLMVLEGGEALRRIATESGTACTGMGRYGVQICPPQLFRPPPHYIQRAHLETRHGLKIIVPHLRDILIAKLHRSRVDGQEGLVPKDRRAFQRVRELSGGHPTLTGCWRTSLHASLVFARWRMTG